VTAVPRAVEREAVRPHFTQCKGCGNWVCIDDVDRLNAALVVTAFRREALFLPDDRLGRWAVAVRTNEVVQWARGALAARTIHDDAWQANVTAALT
jgi:hypothetical protein